MLNKTFATFVYLATVFVNCTFSVKLALLDKPYRDFVDGQFCLVGLLQ